MSDKIQEAVSLLAGFFVLAGLAAWFMFLPSVGLLYVTGFLR